MSAPFRSQTPAQWQRNNALARTERKTDECDKGVGEGTMRMTSRFVQQSALVMGALTLMSLFAGQGMRDARRRGLGQDIRNPWQCGGLRPNQEKVRSIIGFIAPADEEFIRRRCGR